MYLNQRIMNKKKKNLPLNDVSAFSGKFLVYYLFAIQLNQWAKFTHLRCPYSTYHAVSKSGLYLKPFRNEHFKMYIWEEEDRPSTKSITMVFLKQPLALPGCAIKIMPYWGSRENLNLNKKHQTKICIKF